MFDFGKKGESERKPEAVGFGRASDAGASAGSASHGCGILLVPRRPSAIPFMNRS